MSESLSSSNLVRFWQGFCERVGLWVFWLFKARRTIWKEGPTLHHQCLHQYYQCNNLLIIMDSTIKALVCYIFGPFNNLVDTRYVVFKVDRFYCAAGNDFVRKICKDFEIHLNYWTIQLGHSNYYLCFALGWEKKFCALSEPASFCGKPVQTICISRHVWQI